MLFWLFVIMFVVGIVCAILGECFENSVIAAFGLFLGIIFVSVILVCGFVMIGNYGSAEADIAQNNQKYESLVYQLENNLYDNDNDLGKKELYNEIREWNEDLAHYQTIQDSFWFGIFYPNIYDQFEFIEYK